MKRMLWISMAVVICVGLSIGFGRWPIALQGEAGGLELEQTTVASTDESRIPKAVHSLGRLEPKGTLLRIAAPSGNEGNRLELLLVQEGAKVSKGELLGRMDTHARRLASKAQEEARLATALAKLSQVKAGNKQGDIEAARAAVDSAERDLETKLRERNRAEQLKRSNAISDAEQDEFRLKHQVAEAALRQAKSRFDSICEVRGVDLAIAEAEVQFARSSVDLAAANLEATQIIAPSDGTILKIHARPGEQVPSDGLLELGQVELMQAVAEVFEGDIPRVKLGDAASVVIDTTGDKLNGRVVEIGHIVARKRVLTNDPVSDTDARVVEVRIDLEQADIDWLCRLSNARVQIAIGARGSVIAKRDSVPGVIGNVESGMK
jgi:HlyD family secretion protein